MSGKNERYMAAYRQSIGDWEGYNDVMNALHAYAHATGAPLGCSVTAWFLEQKERAEDAGLQALKEKEGE
jgi:hypothetical protein